MSTRALIAIEMAGGSYKAAFKSKDGHIKYTGVRLHKMYQNRADAEALIETYDPDIYASLDMVLIDARTSHLDYVYVYTDELSWLVYNAADGFVDNCQLALEV